MVTEEMISEYIINRLTDIAKEARERENKGAYVAPMMMKRLSKELKRIDIFLWYYQDIKWHTSDNQNRAELDTGTIFSWIASILDSVSKQYEKEIKESQEVKDAN